MSDAVSEYLRAIGKAPAESPDFSDVTSGSSSSSSTRRKRAQKTGDPVLDYMAAAGRDYPEPEPEQPEPAPAKIPVQSARARRDASRDESLAAAGNYVKEELKSGGRAIAEQARDIVRPGGVKRAALGLAHGIIDPAERVFGDPVRRKIKADTNELEAAEAARRMNPGEHSEDFAEEAARGSRRRETIAQLSAGAQVAMMGAAPGISNFVEKKVASKVGAGIIGKLAARAAGESAAGAAFGAAAEPEHPIAGAVSMGAIAPVLGEGGRLAGKGIGAARESSAGLAGRLADRADRVKRLQTELAAEADRRTTAERAADVDELTGAANKRAFSRALPTAEKDPNTAIVRFDVNGFKSVNDIHGHEAGDKALVEIPGSLSKAAAELKIPERVFRVGGDEFAAIVPKELAASFRDRAEELYGVKDHGNDVRTSISGGIGLTDAAADAAAMTRKAAQKAAQGINGRKESIPVPVAAPEGALPSTRIFSHPVKDLHVDPDRFQFKLGTNEKGVTRGLSSVEKFNPKLAGAISVWKDPADGKTYIVNGHHRFELAKRTNTDRLEVQFLDALDAPEARAQGALQNIAEGQGTALDAAKFFRETGVGVDALKREGVELSGRIAKAGLSLSKLEPDVFAKVATGKISESHGAAIGSMLETPEQQRAAANLIENSPKKLTDAQAQELVSQVRSAGSESVQQDDLFGTSTEGVSLIYDRADIASEIKKRLAGDKKLFGYVAKGERASELARGGNKIDVKESERIANVSAILEEAFNREAHASGDVGRAITEAARRVANGEKLKAVVDDIYGSIRESVHASVTGSGAAHGTAAEEGFSGGNREAAAGSTAGESTEVTPLVNESQSRPKYSRPAGSIITPEMHATKIDPMADRRIRQLIIDAQRAEDIAMNFRYGNGKTVKAHIDELFADGYRAAERRGKRTYMVKPGDGLDPSTGGEVKLTLPEETEYFKALLQFPEAVPPRAPRAKVETSGSVADELAGVEDDGHVLDSTDEAQNALFSPARKPERILSAAWLGEDGKTIFRGVNHHDAYEKAVAAKQAPADLINEEASGYETSHGRFVDAEEAMQIAELQEQVRPGSPSDGHSTVASEDLILGSPARGGLSVIRGGGAADARVTGLRPEREVSQSIESASESLASIDRADKPRPAVETADYRREAEIPGVDADGNEVWITRSHELGEGGRWEPFTTTRPRVEPPVEPDILGSPARGKPTVRQSTGETDLFGNAIERDVPAQTSMFGEEAGTAATRGLAASEAAARSELERLHAELPHVDDVVKRGKMASRIAELEKLVNRDKAITPAELATRAIAENGGEPSIEPVAQVVIRPDGAADVVGVGAYEGKIFHRGQFPKTAQATADRINAKLGAKVAAEKLEAPEPVDQETLFSPSKSPSLNRKVAAAKKALGIPQPPADDVKALISISKNLAKALDATLRQGRFLARQRQAVGAFFTKGEQIRVVRYDKVDTVAHEIGHFVSKRYLGNPTQKRGGVVAPKIPLTPEIKAELVQMGKDLYGSRKPNGGYGEEGIAEYFSFYVTEPQTILAKAPKFDAFVRAHVFKDFPALEAALEQARVDFADYHAAPADARLDAMISVNEKVRNTPTVRSIISSVVDDLNEFKEAVKELGGESDPTKNAYTLSRLVRGDAGAGSEMLDGGIINYKTRQRVTRGLREILSEIPKDRIQAFRRYLMSERTIEVAGRGVDTGISLKDAYDNVQRTRAEFEPIAQEIWGISNALIDYRRDAGLLTDAEATFIKAKNQKRVGFYRVFEPEETAASNGAGRGFGRNSSGLQKMKGSARRVIDPLESMITDVYRTVHQANTHAVLDALVDMAEKTEGGGKIVEILTEKPKHRETVPAEEAVRQLADLGFDITSINQQTGQPESIVGMQGVFNAGDVLEAFRENTAPNARDSKDLVFPYIKDGQRQWVAVKDAKLFDAVRGLDRQQMPQWARILTAPTRALRAGATLTLEFIGRNPVRDAWTAAIYSQAGFKPPGWDFARGVFSLLKRDEFYQKWRLEGGDNAAMLGLDRKTTQKHLREYMRSRPEQLRDLVLHPVDVLRLTSSAFENATRIGEFKALHEKALREGATPLQAGKAAAFGARDITIDFAKSGVQGRLINEVVAFFNAAVQSQVKLVHELKTRPHVILPRIAATITLPSIGLYLMQRNDPAYREIPRWQKDLFWIWVQRGDDGNVSHIWRFPKPFELGVMFGSVPERMLEWMETKDPSALDGLRHSIVQTMSPSVIPTAMAPLIENWANKSFFRDRPIVPRGVEKLPAEDQATRYTGETARAIGAAVDYSPAKIENLIRGYTGGLGADYALPIADAAIREGRGLLGKLPLAPDRKSTGSAALRVPGLRGFAGREPGSDAESVERMYRTFEANEARRLKWHELIKQGKKEEARAYFREWRPEIRSVLSKKDTGKEAGSLRNAYTTITKLQDEARSIDQSDLPDSEKKTRMRAVYDQMIGTAREGLGDKHVSELELELMKVGVKMPTDPRVLRAVERVIGSRQYQESDSAAAQAARRDPRYKSTSKISLARQLKHGQIMRAIAGAK